MSPEYLDFFTKFSIAVLGAGTALILNRFVKIQDDKKKYKDIRTLIISDLKKQKLSIGALLDDIHNILPYFMKIMSNDVPPEEMYHQFMMVYGIQTDTFKSQTRMDFFKSFNDDDFHKLMNIYNSIKLLETVNLLAMKNDFLKEYNKLVGKTLEEIDDIQYSHVEYLNQTDVEKLLGYINGITLTSQRIDEFIISTESNYKSKYEIAKEKFKIPFKRISN